MADLLRRSNVHAAKNEIRTLEKCIENDEILLANMMDQKGAEDFRLFQQNKIRTANDERAARIAELKQRVEDITDGKLDAELVGAARSVRHEVLAKNSVTMKRKKDIKEKKAEQSVVSKTFYIENRRNDRRNKYENKNLNRAFRYYNRVVTSLPDYMKRNLKRMPNNKGYMWRGVTFFGKGSFNERNPIVVFEKRRNRLMIIHEWTRTEYNVYHKYGKDRKNLISSKPRKVHVIN